MSAAGKGDTPRPVNPSVYRANFAAIAWRTPRSACCGARMRVAGRDGMGSTRWHECTRCGQPCDPSPMPYEL